jgi:hypothetical protein
MKMELIECSETSAYKIQTPGNHPEENIQHTEHGESLKSKTLCLFTDVQVMVADRHNLQREVFTLQNIAKKVWNGNVTRQI